jgi:hypothetical protein
MSTTLWDVSIPEHPYLLTTKEQGHVIIRAIYGKEKMEFVVLEGSLPDAGNFLIGILRTARCFGFEVRHSKIGTPDDYEIQDLICRITDIEVIRRHIPNLIARYPDDVQHGSVCRVLIKCEIEWFWKGQGR